MATAFREKLEEWALRCDGFGETIIIWLDPAFTGGERESYKEARRIIVAFASMVSARRKKVRKDTERRGTAMVESTPYENVICRIVKPKIRPGFEVHFIKQESGYLDRLYQEVGPEPDVPEASLILEELAQPEPVEPIPSTEIPRKFDPTDVKPTKTFAEMFATPVDNGENGV